MITSITSYQQPKYITLHTNNKKANACQPSKALCFGSTQSQDPKLVRWVLKPLFAAGMTVGAVLSGINVSVFFINALREHNTVDIATGTGLIGAYAFVLYQILSGIRKKS